MPEELVSQITRYGYLAIFVMVFLQETGFPNPFPNELLLLFSGYLCFKGMLYLPLVIITVVFADLAGTCILYFLFYSAGNIIIQRKPKWIPLSHHTLNRLKEKISGGGLWAVYLFRITPFTRGYASVITGLLQIKPKIYLPLALITATTWASFYIIVGHLMGPSWEDFLQNTDKLKNVLLAVVLVTLCAVIYSAARKFRFQKK
jgi:membrane protein DedA with SNARE-associated domain